MYWLWVDDFRYLYRPRYDGSKNLDGILLENMYIGIAEYYSAELSQKVKRGIYENYQKGLYHDWYAYHGWNCVAY